MIHPSFRLRSGELYRVVFIATVAAAVLMVVAGCRQGNQSQAGGLTDGQTLYHANCTSCHGPDGDGHGPAAYLLFPKPRNFQRAQFKLRSTPPGILPTDADLARTIQQGIPGSSMLSFGELLNEDQIAELVDHVKSFSPRFGEQVPLATDQLLQIPAPPSPTPELVAIGEQVYVDFRCGQCHGPDGRGDGPSAATLKDSEGDPFPAADFTYGIYKSGGSPEALYSTFLTGMEGTPMPSFAGAFGSDDQVWGLVYYILSLAPGGRAQTAQSDPGPVPVTAVTGNHGTEDPWSPVWDTIAPHRVALQPLWYRNDYPPFVNLRAARVGDELALLLEWQDASRDESTLRTEDFADGVAVQFALTDPPPFIGMGQAGSGGEVEIWYWRADRQVAGDDGAPKTLAAAYPRITVDRYQHASDAAPGAEPYESGDLPGDDHAPFAPARDLGNPTADPELSKRPVHALAAAGFGTLTARSADVMTSSGGGGWQDGTYRVLFVAPMGPSNSAFEVDFAAGPVPMAVAIWNGSAGDRNGTKLVSQWQRLEALDDSPPPLSAQETPKE